MQALNGLLHPIRKKYGNSGATLDQTVIADGITVRRAIAGYAFDSRHHLQFTVIRRNLCKEFRDDFENAFSATCNPRRGKIPVAGDGRELNLVCWFSADRFDVW